MGAEVAGGEVGHGGAGLGRGRDGLVAALDAVDDLGGAEPGLGRGELAVGAQGDPPGPAAGPALDDVDLAARGVDPDPEAGELAVPEDPVPALDREAVHRPARQRQPATARHGRGVSRARSSSSRRGAAASMRKRAESPARARKHPASGRPSAGAFPAAPISIVLEWFSAVSRGLLRAAGRLRARAPAESRLGHEASSLPWLLSDCCDRICDGISVLILVRSGSCLRFFFGLTGAVSKPEDAVPTVGWKRV